AEDAVDVHTRLREDPGMVHEVPLEAPGSLDGLEEEVDVALRPGSRIQHRVTYGVRQGGRAYPLLDRLQLTTEEDAVVDDKDIRRVVEQPGHSGRIAWPRLQDATLDQPLDVR